MSPILDSIGSVKGFGWGKILSSTSFESIATVSVGSGGATSAEFTSIPATYSHLQVRLLARDTRNASGDNFSIQFNSDTTAANYVSYHWILGDGSTVTAGALAAGVQGQIVIGEVSTAQTSASIFSAGVFDILDYANTNKYKTVRNLNGSFSTSPGSRSFNLPVVSGTIT